MKLPQNSIEKMLTHAKDGYPYECCGLLAGNDGVVKKTYAMTNVLKSPTKYQVDPTEHIKALKSMRELGYELVGVFHSHPDSVAYPSVTDISLAFYPEIEYLIISLADKLNPVVKSFKIIDEVVTEEKIVILKV